MNNLEHPEYSIFVFTRVDSSNYIGFTQIYWMGLSLKDLVNATSTIAML